MRITKLGTVFVHVPKTAGQSIELALCNAIEVDWDRRRDFEGLLLGKSSPPDRPTSLCHLTAEEYVRFGYVEQDEWEAAFTFAVVRNPWQRIVSVYHYLAYDFQYSFNNWVLNRMPNPGYDPDGLMVRPQTEYVCDGNGEVLVDKLLRFENLNAEWPNVARRLHLGQELPRINSKRKWSWSPHDMVRLGRRRGYAEASKYYRSQFPPWRDHYTARSYRRVAELYASDIETFGYGDLV